MARSTIQDQPPANTAASFERQPPHDLEDTRPFSLLNALLDGVEGAMPYEPPPLAQPEDLSEETLPLLNASAPSIAGEPASRDSEADRAANADEVDGPTPAKADEESETKDQDSAPLFTETKDTPGASEPSTTASKEISALEPDNEPKPLPLSFPKISAELPPPPPPPRPKSRRFSTATPPLAKLQNRERSKTAPTTKPPRGNQPWERRGFQGAPANEPTSFDPINKAIRIFESLSTESKDDQETTQRDAPSSKIDGSSLASTSGRTSRSSATEEVPLSAEGTASDPVKESSPKSEKSEKGEATPQAPPKSEEDLAELDTVKIQLPRNRVAKPTPPEPKPKPEVPKGLSGIEPKELAPPMEPLVPAAPAPKPATDPPVLEEPVRPKPKAPDTPAVAPPQEGRTIQPIPVRRRRRRRVPLNPWTAKRSDPLQGSDGRKDRNEHIHKTLNDLAKMLESSLLTSTSESAPADEATTKVKLRQTFSEEQKATPSRSSSKVKLMPRALSEKDTDTAMPSTTGKATSSEDAQPAVAPDYEITAPTTLVAENAPISPFTKVTRAETKKITQPEAQQSPFTIAKGPTVVSQASKETQAKVFASPFSTALKKHKERGAGEDVPAKQASAPAQELNISPISPPGSHPDQEAALAQGQLPAPTYSFATMGLPSSEGKAPSTSPPSPVTAAPMAAQVPPTAAPVPPSPFSKAEQSSEDKTATPERATDRAHRPLPEPNTWGMLTWVLCVICGIFFLIYLYEIYQTLSDPVRNTPAVIPQDQEEAIQDSPSAVEMETETEEPEPSPGVSPDTTETESTEPPVSLSDPMEILSGFLKADTEEVRDQYLVEDEDLNARMAEHYANFPMQAGSPLQIVDSGTFSDTGRSYVVVKTLWADESETDTILIKDSSGNYHFSWYAFEQSRNQLVRHYAETAWTGWTQFFVEIRPIDPDSLPTGTVLDNLYYRITAPEDPEFEAIGYVDGLSSMAMEFKERFPNSSTYQVYLGLMRGEPFHEDPRPLFRITSLIRESWDATP